ncbi:MULTISPECIES: hypothetical protein [Burkholderia]|uniref:hypothetical protein n=1 Tax=Burkholderia TaxID=32008 RepID=UPI001F1F8F50|nr:MULTISPECIES: hypothetical protein [Burkholderia]
MSESAARVALTLIAGSVDAAGASVGATALCAHAVEADITEIAPDSAMAIRVKGNMSLCVWLW